MTGLSVRGIVVIGLSAAVLAGCQHKFVDTKPTFVKSQDEAGAVLVTENGATPWSDVSDALAPKFTMSGDAALAKVLPTTERINEQVLNALGFSLGVGLPTSSRSVTSTQTGSLSSNSVTDADGVTKVTGAGSNAGNYTVTDTKGPGTAPAAPTGNPAGVTTPVMAAPTGDLGLDPVLQYKAANYLHQTVQLLNREVQAAALRECYVPYVVGLKFAVMTYRPRLGYSLHTRVSFFNADEPALHPVRAPGAAAAPLSIAQADALQAERDLADSPCSESRPAGQDAATAVPIVVPLLAADDMQVAVKSRAMEAAQQIGLSLSAMQGGVGANAGFNSLNAQLKAIMNRDLSSTLTVGRQAENTLYVRIAPNNEASGDPAMVGQTYNISVLLLVPVAYFDADAGAAHPIPVNVSFTTQTEFRNALDGTILPPRSAAALAAQLDRKLDPFLTPTDRAQWALVTPAERAMIAQAMVGPIQTAQYAAFLDVLDCPLRYDLCRKPYDAASPSKDFSLASVRDRNFGRTLWTSLAGLEADTPFKSGLIEIERPRPLTVGDQDVLVIDDGKATASAVLTNISGGAARRLTARLELTAKGGTGDVVRLPAQAVAYDPATRNLSLTFPSPGKWGVGDIDPATVSNRLVLGLAACDARRALCPGLVAPPGNTLRPVRVVAAEKDDKAEFTFSQSTTVVTPKDGAGTIKVRIAKLPAGMTVKLGVAGADVTAVTDPAGAVVALVDGGYLVGVAGDVMISLFNLGAGRAVTVSAQGMKGTAKSGPAAAPLTFLVQNVD